REPVAERREVDVGDVQHRDLVAAPERVGFYGGVGLSGARDDPLQLGAEIADAPERSLDRTEQLRGQGERSAVAGREERFRVVGLERESLGAGDRDETDQ